MIIHQRKLINILANRSVLKKLQVKITRFASIFKGFKPIHNYLITITFIGNKKSSNTAADDRVTSGLTIHRPSSNNGFSMAYELKKGNQEIKK